MSFSSNRSFHFLFILALVWTGQNLSLSASSSSTTITAQIQNSSDDAYEDGANIDSMGLGLFMGGCAETPQCLSGMRFNNLLIPQGAPIISAHIEVYLEQGEWSYVTYTYAGDATGNSKTFSPVDRPSQRSLTTNQILYNKDENWLGGTWHLTDELGSIVQEIVNRSDWQPGNSISIILANGANNRKSVVSNDGDPLKAPKLVITYAGDIVAPPPPPPPGPIGAVKPLPLISRGLPAYSASGTPTSANDNFYNSYWNGTIPASLAYDLSSLPTSKRGPVILAWYNDPLTKAYETNVGVESPVYNLKDYTIEANSAPGGGPPPTSGWVILKTVTGNTYHSRQHLINLTGYNWVRLNVTAGDGGGTIAGINMDLHDASQGVEDDWLFIGDSITSWGMHHGTENAEGNYAQQINGANSSYFPVYEDAAVGGYNSGSIATKIGTYLSMFPGKFVTINLGTNDANGNVGTTTYYNNMETIVKAVLAAGKVPIIPKIPYGTTAAVMANGPAINAMIDQLYAAYPQIVKGPDFWPFFQNNQNLLADSLHPNSAGYAAMRQMWRDTMLANVYFPSGVSATPPTAPKNFRLR